MKIGIGNDHVGFDYKDIIRSHLEARGHTIIDYGAHSRTPADYPIFANKVGRAVVAGEIDVGILICGTGTGMSIAANKIRGIRCAACSEPYSARLAKQHNNANILAFGSRVIGTEVAKMMVDEWLGATFEPRHQRRLDMVE